MARISVARDVQRPQDFASDGTDAVGFVQFWGNSPSLDLVGQDPQAAAFGPAAVGTSPSGINRSQEAAKPDAATVQAVEDSAADGAEEASDSGDDGVVVSGEACEEEPEPCSLPDGDGVVNVLIAGGADIRHVVKTVSRRGRRASGRLRFFLHESHHESLARHVLFLQIVNNTALPIRERMEVFLSLYGNTLVRERDSAFVGEIAKEFIELITDNSSHPIAQIIDLSHLKFKDRDVLQDIFKGWLADVPFDVEALREQRCRGYYRDRYDFRKNLMDWDYTSNIKEVAGIINWFHYKEFCHSGVAFETRLASYSSPNRTLASYTEAMDRVRGTPVQVRGFWGDIINSPYHAFSTSTDPQDKPRLFKITGSQYRHTETDIAEFNLTAYLSEMDTGQAFHLPPERPEEHVFPYTSPLETLQTAKAEDRRRVRRPPRLEMPEQLGARRERSTLAEVVCETLKYQAHFDASVRLGFRHRLAQAGHLAGWRLADERRAVPCLEADMKEKRAKELEKHATDFLRFVTPALPCGGQTWKPREVGALEEQGAWFGEGAVGAEDAAALREEILRAHGAGLLTQSGNKLAVRGADGHRGGVVMEKPGILEADVIVDGEEAMPQVLERCPTLARLLRGEAGLRHAVNAAWPELALDRLEQAKVAVNVGPRDGGPGGAFPFHFDVSSSKDARRQLTALLYLNPDWQDGDGGEVELLPFPFPDLLVAP
ncbi:unnamed protein product, partial [Prorocentrum cordatum]